MRTLVRGCVFFAALLAFSAPARAASITVVGDNGTLSASATFDITGNVLTITLENTDTQTDYVPSEVLTGLFFDLDGFTGSLTAVSADVTAGSDIIQADTCVAGNPASDNSAACASATNVSGEFGYATSASGFNGGTLGDYGISSSGYIDGNGSQFPGGSNLDNPNSLDGVNFGIVGSGYLTGNTGVTGEPLIQDSVTFTFNFTGTLLTSMIQNVGFVYGTAFGEGQITTENITTENITTEDITSVPEPTTLALLGTGLLGVARSIRRKKRASAAA